MGFFIRALMLNLFVSLVAFIQFYKGGHFHFRSFLPFAMASIPLSFLGGLMYIDSLIYKILLGVFLIFAIVRMLFFDDFNTLLFFDNCLFFMVPLGKYYKFAYEIFSSKSRHLLHQTLHIFINIEFFSLAYKICTNIFSKKTTLVFYIINNLILDVGY